MNIRPSSFHDPNFQLDALQRTLDRCGLAPRDVVFEISEQESIENYEIFREARDNYGKLGFQFALDDTGAGYASLEAVMELAPEFIKVDRAFVQGIDQDSSRRTWCAFHLIARDMNRASSARASTRSRSCGRSETWASPSDRAGSSAGPLRSEPTAAESQTYFARVTRRMRSPLKLPITSSSPIRSAAVPAPIGGPTFSYSARGLSDSGSSCTIEKWNGQAPRSSSPQASISFRGALCEATSKLPSGLQSTLSGLDLDRGQRLAALSRDLAHPSPRYRSMKSDSPSGDASIPFGIGPSLPGTF
jgi:hypothetical protein